MPTLSKVTSETKFIIKWGSIIILTLFIVFIVAKIGPVIKEKLHPTPPPPPTVSFGKLEALKFPANATDKALIYVIDTISGTLPVFPDRAKIYKIILNRANFLSLENAQNKVSKLGFGTQKSLISENTYQWIDRNTLLRKIAFNILSSDFTFSSSFVTDPTIQSGINLPSESEAINIAKTFLGTLSSFPNDIDTTKTKTSYHTIKNYTIIPSTSISKAQIIRVDFFQNNVDKLPIYYPGALSSTINLLISGGQDNPQVVEALYSYKNISNESATYPIKSASDAFLELKQGKAYISSNAKKDTNVAIKNILLGYYLGKDEQKYLMPIIIFEGDNDFFAYISAVKEEWVGN